jgi:hypothetical protein
MSDHLFDRAVRDWLEDGSDRTPRSAIDGVLLAVKTTPQERDLRIPWRFTRMTNTMRLAAGIAIVAVIGFGALQFLGPGSGVGSKATPSPSPTVAPTLPPGITGWTTYTSKVYGYTLSYPSDWSVYAPATRKFQQGDLAFPEIPTADVFENSEAIDGDSIGLFVMQLPAPAGADLNSWEGLLAAFREMCKPEFSSIACPTADPATPMCLGDQACRPAIIALVSDERTPSALFGDPDNAIVTLFSLGRPDDFPAAARYGGAVTLLKSILSQVDVRVPQPGETPH